jgi:hypothetical protein
VGGLVERGSPVDGRLVVVIFADGRFGKEDLDVAAVVVVLLWIGEDIGRMLGLVLSG